MSQLEKTIDEVEDQTPEDNVNTKGVKNTNKEEISSFKEGRIKVKDFSASDIIDNIEVKSFYWSRRARHSNPNLDERKHYGLNTDQLIQAELAFPLQELSDTIVMDKDSLLAIMWQALKEMKKELESVKSKN